MQGAQRIFISYRRSDAQSQANGLNDGLRNRLPGAQIFMDIDSIPPGADFEEHIRGEIAQCDVVLVMIGDQWLDVRPGTAVRRIDEPQDFVRLEVQSALETGRVRVIPVLVEGAQMPGAAELPDDISRLARLNAFELSDTRWTKDIETLSGILRGSGPTPAPGAPNTPTVSFDDLDLDAVKYAVSQLPRQFATKDVSTHPAMLATHDGVASRANYHTMVGRFLMKHRAELGLGSPNSPVDDRGSRWVKAAAQASQAGPPATATPTGWYPPPVSGAPTAPQTAPTPAAWYPPPAPVGPPNGGTKRPGIWVILLPLFTVGLLAFIPPLWFSGRLKHDLARRKRMLTFAGALGAATAVAFILIGVSPTDAQGNASGPLSDAGAWIAFACLIVGVVLGVNIRKR
ncbi:TIR domain-containing protein [Nocardioides exalbidus]|uniref:TIR domain-containing protein n=1 Tax=Nocardioides exalbidus TaxID=402596 RepID=A0A1H4L023_9ACTN|nr:toll/interleukin-1 receptor domain-containing protein [Nocardioides exalbidus]SEB63522.1 TIR domain-containing protein [Nocardioides exalbidus]